MSRSRPARQLSLASRLAIAVIVVAASAIATASTIGLVTGTRANDRLVDQRLVTAVSAEQFEVLAALNRLRSQVDLIASGPSTAMSIERLRTATEELRLPSTSVIAGEREALRQHYQRQVLPVLERTEGGDLDVSDLLPGTDVGVHLQHAVVVASAGRLDNVDVDLPAVDDAWAELHAEIHPVYRRTAAQLDAEDLLLVDADGRVLYSVVKAADFATDLVVGPHSGGPLGRALRTLLDGTDHQDDRTGHTSAVVTELAVHAPAGGRPSWFVLAPVPLSDGTTGAFVVRFGVDALDRLLGDPDGGPIALGDSGGVHLAGPDSLLRSDPRAFRDDANAYVESAVQAGTLGADEAEVARARGTTALIARTDGDVVAAALSSDPGPTVFDRTDHLGRPSRMVASPLGLDGLDWVVVAELTAEEATAPLDRYRQQLLALTAALVVAVTFAGMAWANRLAAPLRELTERVIDRNDDPDVPIGDGPHRPDDGTDARRDEPQSPRRSNELGLLVERVTELHAGLDQRRSAREQAHRSWLTTLRSLLPTHLVRRAEAGDELTHDVTPAATVVVLAIHGLTTAPDTTRPDGPGADTTQHDTTRYDTASEVIAHVDAVAERRDIERITVLGDTVVAVVGHRSPVLDHARRAALFARELVRNPIGATGVELAAGVASGPVLTGLSGTEHLVYDAWGPTVMRAVAAAHRAAPGTVDLDESVIDRLPDELLTDITGTTQS